MQLVELHCGHRLSLLLDLQSMEIVGSRARLPQHSLHRAFIDVTNVRARRDRAAVAQTFHDALERFVGHLGVLLQSAASFAKALAAVRAIQSANVFAFADPFDDAEIASVESIEGGAIFIGTREVRQRVWLAA
jgi:hypothetical protein